jgi:hypothetical protein
MPTLVVLPYNAEPCFGVLLNLDTIQPIRASYPGVTRRHHVGTNATLSSVILVWCSDCCKSDSAITVANSFLSNLSVRDGFWVFVGGSAYDFYGVFAKCLVSFVVGQNSFRQKKSALGLCKMTSVEKSRIDYLWA